MRKISWEQGVASRLRVRQSWGLRTLYGHRVRAPPAPDGIGEPPLPPPRMALLPRLVRGVNPSLARPIFTLPDLSSLSPFSGQDGNGSGPQVYHERKIFPCVVELTDVCNPHERSD